MEEKKKKNIIAIVLGILLVLCIAIGAIFYFIISKVYDVTVSEMDILKERYSITAEELKEINDIVINKKSSSDNQTNENNNSTKKEEVSYLFYENEKNITNKANYKIEKVTNSEDDYYYNLISNGTVFKKIYTSSITKAYFIKDLILLDENGSDGTKTLVFIDLKGNEIKKIDELNDLTITYYDNYSVNENEIIFTARIYGGRICDLSENTDVFGTYKIKYIGNNNFSEIETISSISNRDLC